MGGISSVIDMDEIMEIMDDDKALIKECFNDFIEEYPRMLTRIKNAITAGSASDLNASAHKIKGTLKYLAAHPAAEIAYKLETMGEEGDLVKAENELENLTKACDSLKDFMNRYEA